MNNFQKRSLSGIGIVAILLAGTLIHPFVFAAVFGTILFFALTEFYGLSEKAELFPQKNTGRIIALLLFAICFLIAGNYISQAFILLIIPLLFVILIGELFRTQKGNSLKNASVTLLGLIYVALPFSLLNFIILPNTPSASFYPWILTGLLFIIWVYDSMAYVTGSLLGKHKIAAKISPAKSWEGFIGGTVFAVIMGIINAVLFQEVDMVNWIIIALIAVVFGTLGDFFESKFKRELGIKDSGNIMPGHGGFLDRFDSLLFAAPMVFVWLNIMDKL